MFKLTKKKKNKDMGEVSNQPKDNLVSSIDMKNYTKIINEVFWGLQMFVRDVNLSEKYESKYKQDMIIHELGFTDASDRVMGMATSHRYAILSNHMGKLSQFEHGTNWGLCVAKNGAHFKILDIYKFQNRTQILLLHLPDDEKWKMFENVKISIEKDLIEDSRKRFEDKCLQEILPELATEQWIARCAAPLGMNDNGELFQL